MDSIFTEKICGAIKLHEFKKLLEFAEFDFKIIVEKDLLYDLLECKDQSIIEYVIDRGINLDTKDENDQSLLHLSIVSSGQYNFFVKYLIDRKINLESMDIELRRPIHKACLLGEFPIVKYLVENDVDLECTDIEGKKPIHYALEVSNFEIFPYLIDKVNLESIDKNGRKAIHYACLNTSSFNFFSCEFLYREKPIDYDINTAHLKFIKMLLQKNIDIESIDFFGKKPIDYAIEKNDQSMIKLFNR